MTVATETEHALILVRFWQAQLRMKQCAGENKVSLLESKNASGAQCRAHTLQKKG